MSRIEVHLLSIQPLIDYIKCTTSFKLESMSEECHIPSKQMVENNFDLQITSFNKMD